MWTTDGALWRNRRVLLAVWTVVVLAALPFAAHEADKLSGGGFTDLASQSGKVETAISDGEFPRVHGGTLVAVLVPRAGATAADMRSAVGSVALKAGRVGGVSVGARARHLSLVAAQRRPGRPVIVPIGFHGSEQHSIDVARDLRSQLGIEGSQAGEAASGRVQVHLAGEGALWAAVGQLADENARQAEARGFPVIAIVLLVAFGSLAAAALPLSLGAAAVAVASALIYFLSQATEMSVFVTNIASMIGIGVAVDYSLFILVRYREEVAAGATPEAARAGALATSGRAVVFSGVTVVSSLAALFLIPSTGIRSMAVGAILVVAISVLAACSLLPVMLGRRAHEPGRIGRALKAARARRARPDRAPFWVRWTNVVMRRPALSVIAATALVLALAVPALSLHVRNNATSQLPSGHETRVGLRAAAGVLGPGALGPAYVVADFGSSDVGGRVVRRTLGRLVTALHGDPLVGAVAPPRRSRDGRSRLLEVRFRTDPESEAARTGVDRLRGKLAAAAGGRATVMVGGTTAVLLDFDNLVTHSLWRLVLFVLALTFVVLLLLLRSVVLPLKAMVMNVLSVAAAYGVLVAVYQWGWLEFLGVHKTPAMYPIVLPLVLVVAFGLSMDYHVFLLSRVRERYAATGDNRRAVAEALASSATPITSAALIMVAVFLAFVSAGEPSIKQIGLAAAVAVAVDATIVRLVIVPAAMQLLGRWNWWMPRTLARVVPEVGAEGPRPVRLDVPRRTAETEG